jgi:hypothetical protein
MNISLDLNHPSLLYWSRKMPTPNTYAPSAHLITRDKASPNTSRHVPSIGADRMVFFWTMSCTDQTHRRLKQNSDTKELYSYTYINDFFNFFFSFIYMFVYILNSEGQKSFMMAMQNIYLQMLRKENDKILQYVSISAATPYLRNRIIRDASVCLNYQSPPYPNIRMDNIAYEREVRDLCTLEKLT